MTNKERYRICFTMKAEGEEAEVLVYSEISNDKWFGDETTPGDFDKALKEARKNGANKLNVRINSGGGEVYAAVAMRSMIMNAGFDSVRVMIEGLCASAATLFATVPGAHVVIAEGSEFMIHNPMTITWGNADEIMKTVDHLHKMEDQFHQMYSAKTGESEERIKDWMDAETWFTAKEACDYGFCDELLASEPVAACVTAREMGVMKDIYKAVPECIAVKDQDFEKDGVVGDAPIMRGDDGIERIIHADSPLQKGTEFGDAIRNLVNTLVSNGTPVAGAPTEINNHEEEDSHMDIKDINLDQLRADNPALVDQIRQDAVTAERQRIEDIEALTDPGYEELAAKAKADGTSAMDFHKQIIEAKKQKGKDFITNRQKETAPAASVPGSTAQSGKTEEQEILDNAKEIAAYAQEFSGSNNESMF